uniref:FCP1 homology domain-containing protein n=1 Tax=Hanusia phi TaxID=3032 RepID=A0A7S0EIA9_9CRYP|mmetsp:Transcript_25105/g.56677  ORF Transcript_25105/g.56677 Transcript_25105/m.56677 type:complete len:247 (+) Transcript_25105:142-882(+)
MKDCFGLKLLLERIFSVIARKFAFLRRGWLILKTACMSYPDPLLHMRECRPAYQITESFSPRKMTLILDLDETLVHSSVKPLDYYNWKIHIPASGDQRSCTFFVAVRPHTSLFLQAVSRWYEVVVFTASLQHYADPVIDLIDPGNCVSRRFFRPSCRVEQGNFLKDISVVRKDLSQVVIVDNCPVAYSLHADNGIPIQTWHNDPNDDALLSLLPILSGLVLLKDVRSILSLRRMGSNGRTVVKQAI